MTPKLYQKDGTTLIGDLINCIECLVEEERNGIFEVTFQYPNTESIASSLVYDNIVICDANDTLKNQKFRIYDTRRMMNNTIEVYARHISFDLAYDYINSIDITNQSCEYALNTIFRNSQFCTGYVGHSDIVNAQNYKISNCNALEAIAGKQGSIIDTYGTGAEILRDNTDIYVLNRRGNDNEVSIEYAKNLTGFELQENTDDLITRIIPFATYTPEGGEQTRVQGAAVDSSYISNYSHPFIAELDFSDKFKDKEVPTTAKLATMAQLYFEENKCDLPKQNWKIEFIPLSKCVGYESIEDAISLCDTVTIRDTRYGIDTKAKVIKTVYDVLRERYDSMELGEPRTTLGDIVNTGSEKGEQGPPGPQGPKGEDGNIGDFPDSVPSAPVLTTTLLGFASIQLDWTYENKPYYWYEVYASKTKDFTPNLFDIIHKGQTSSFLFQAEPGETWYFRVCGVNSYDHRSGFSDQKEVVTTKVDDLSNYFTTAAIGHAVVGSLTADYMSAGILKGQWIDAKNLSVTDGNGKRTLDIDSFGNVNLDVTSLKIQSKNAAIKEDVDKKVGSDEIISKINISPENIKIQANQIDMTGALDLHGTFTCYADENNHNGNKLVQSAAIHRGYLAGWNEPVFSSGIWRPDGTNDVGFVSVGWANSDHFDTHGCIYLSPMVGGGGMLSYGRKINETTGNIANSTIEFPESGEIRYKCFIGDKAGARVYGHQFDSGISCFAFNSMNVCSDSWIQCDSTVFTNAQNLYLVPGGYSNQYYAYMNYDGYFNPGGASQLGSSDAPWYTLVCTYSPQVASDARKKTDICYIDCPAVTTFTMSDEEPAVPIMSREDMYNFIRDDLRLATYKLRDSRENDANRIEIGFLAQDIMDTKVGKYIINDSDPDNLTYDTANRVSVLEGALQSTIERVEYLMSVIEEQQEIIDNLLANKSINNNEGE